MDRNQIAHTLDIFAQYPRYFALEELLNFADSDSTNKILRSALLADPRFVQLSEGNSTERYFIPKKSLFQWFCQLSLRLAAAKQARLSKRKVAMLMSSLRTDGRWDIPPARCIELAQHFGFIGPAWVADQYVFPMAHILSFTQDPTKVASIVMENFTAEGGTHRAFEQLAQELTQDGLSKFTGRQRYIIQAREGLLTGRRMTLQRVGDRLGVTRERVRQIEVQFWKKLHHDPRGRSPTLLFSTALICHIISKQGSLIIPQTSTEIFLASFLAKCTGVPQAEFPYAGILILGVSQADIPEYELNGPLRTRLNVDFIATRLESNGLFCLLGSDLKALAENIIECIQVGQILNQILLVYAQFRRKDFTKEERVYLALRTSRAPAHYSEVTEVHNFLFPNHPSSERNIHAVLNREKYGVVWIGIKGTFALKEWGYEHPSTTLFDAVTEIVEQRHKVTAQPVPFAVIAAEIGKRRRLVNPNSLVLATQCNPKLRRIGKNSFVLKEPSEEMQEGISAEELDRILREFEKGEATP